jgi:hypothetical protein
MRDTSALTACLWLFFGVHPSGVRAARGSEKMWDSVRKGNGFLFWRPPPWPWRRNARWGPSRHTPPRNICTHPSRVTPLSRTPVEVLPTRGTVAHSQRDRLSVVAGASDVGDLIATAWDGGRTPPHQVVAEVLLPGGAKVANRESRIV